MPLKYHRYAICQITLHAFMGDVCRIQITYEVAVIKNAAKFPAPKWQWCKMTVTMTKDSDDDTVQLHILS